MIVVRRDDFIIIQDESLPGISALLDGILRQLEQEEKEENPETSEQQLINPFTAVSAERLLIAYISNKRKEKYDPNVPKSFSEACEYPGWCTAIDRKYNALIQRNTW